MGHEYIELKNTHAAIESYRRAVDVNRKDYRAWYGLGQAYEVLDMSFYALYYYQRAAGLRPYDPEDVAGSRIVLREDGEDGASYQSSQTSVLLQEHILKHRIVHKSSFDANSVSTEHTQPRLT